MNKAEAVKTDVEAMTKYREDAVVLLQAVRSSLADLLRRVMEGETGAVKDVSSKQAELESALKRVFEVESKYHDWIRRERGAVAPGEIDLDAARTEIGCRLHRLRSCNDAG